MLSLKALAHENESESTCTWKCWVWRYLRMKTSSLNAFAHEHFESEGACTWKFRVWKRLHMKISSLKALAPENIESQSTCTWKCWVWTHLRMKNLSLKALAHENVESVSACTWKIDAFANDVRCASVNIQQPKSLLMSKPLDLARACLQGAMMRMHEKKLCPTPIFDSLRKLWKCSLKGHFSTAWKKWNSFLTSKSKVSAWTCPHGVKPLNPKIRQRFPLGGGAGPTPCICAYV